MGSIIRSFTKEELQKLANESTSLTNLLRKVGLQPKGANRKTLNRIIEEYNLDLSKLIENRRVQYLNINQRIQKELSYLDKDVFVENSKYARVHLKERILKKKIINYKCRKCGNEGKWEGEALSLQLEHKNGISNDNRLENLEFLCPNCHSQTQHYAGKNIKSVFIKNRKKLINEIKQKKEFNIVLEKRKKDLDSINLLKFGWVGKVARLWGTRHSHVRDWVKRYYPELITFERSKI
jgi:5-methylcytosine-specific restriction endonuclease McrA